MKSQAPSAWARSTAPATASSSATSPSKSSPAALAGDAQYNARFEREAQMLAALNHPNIAPVHGIEPGRLKAIAPERPVQTKTIAR